MYDLSPEVSFAGTGLQVHLQWNKLRRGIHFIFVECLKVEMLRRCISYSVDECLYLVQIVTSEVLEMAVDDRK